MRQSRDWSRLVESIRSGRYHGSKFYKPVCLIAAIDLVDLGAIDPLKVDANKIIDQFGDYVRPHFRSVARLDGSHSGISPMTGFGVSWRTDASLARRR